MPASSAGYISNWWRGCGRPRSRSRRQQAAGGCQIAAGTVATDRQPLWVQPEAPGVVLQPVPGVGDVMQWNRERMFRRQPVAHGDNHAAAGIGQSATGTVVDRQRTLEPAAAMREQQGRRRSIGQPFRCVKADFQCMPVACDHRMFDHMRNRLRRALQLGQRALADRTQFPQVVGQWLRRHGVDELLQRRFKLHGVPPAGTAAAVQGMPAALLP